MAWVFSPRGEHALVFPALRPLLRLADDRPNDRVEHDQSVSHTALIVKGMPTFSREEIVHLGDLARIALTDEEITRLQGELNVIADSINEVQKVAGPDVQPTANPVPLEAYLRPDVAETPLTQAEALAGGPKTEAGMFVAPRIQE
ncbi:glutamyl-tRNA amidotransferase subunit C [Bifidobacterium vansinderenii]|uniref:Aspartyl/glutamyl-tRNA(Asn/Gln) amidotransferase subunit C n=3 Tax=Bifidobacterium TaxID=1678 RepID=A0A229VXQ0_9BIFI|nr:glutamyl-tRNA amidotransferase subunit C [Bifidobacterium vansinderenii]